MVTQLPVKELIVGSNPTRGARIKLASESRKLARAARSAAQGGEAVSWTSLFCNQVQEIQSRRFLEGRIFWREMQIRTAAECLPHPPVRAQNYSSPCEAPLFRIGYFAVRFLNRLTGFSRFVGFFFLNYFFVKNLLNAYFHCFKVL